MLQPGHRFSIQVVGGLIEQQHIGLGEQQTAERYAALFTARQFADDGIPWRQAQRVRGDLEFALEFPTAYGIDLVLHLRLFFHEFVHGVIRHWLGKLVADGVEAVEQTLNFAHALR